MNNQTKKYLPCRICGQDAYIPKPVHGDNHEHWQVSCNDCGIEVCRLTEDEALNIWNRLMRNKAKNL